MRKTIPIFFAIDEGYVPYLSVAIASLIENANKNYKYILHVIHQDLTRDSIKKIKSLETNYAKIKFVKMKNSLEAITDRTENRLATDYFTLTIYYRIFLPIMFPRYDKGIYLDSDIVINGDISELFNVDIGDKLIGGITDNVICSHPIISRYAEKAVGIPKNKYINSGVLLMNMKKLRDINFEKHFLYLLNKYHFDTIAPDQDYINAMCKDHILYFPYEWNTMPFKEKTTKKKPKLVHYNLFSKPWHYDNIAYEEYFWKYANKSLFKDRIVEEKNGYSKQLQLKDSKNFQLFLKRCKSIPKMDITFKSVLEADKEARL